MKNSKNKVIWKSKNRESLTGKANRARQKEWMERMKEANRYEDESMWDSPPQTFQLPVYDEPIFTMQRDGNAVIRFENEAVWSMAERPQGQYAKNIETLRAGDVLRVNQSLVSPSFEYVCTYQENGNMVVYRNGQRSWHTNTEGSSVNGVTQELDGNLILRDSAKRIKWQHRGGYSGESKTVMQDDGNLVTYVSGKSIWSCYSG
jgi:hypothetical protein